MSSTPALLQSVRKAILTAIQENRALFFVDPEVAGLSCMIGKAVITFFEEEDGSYTVRHQNQTIFWIRETPGWAELTSAIALASAAGNQCDLTKMRARIYENLHEFLISPHA